MWFHRGIRQIAGICSCICQTAWSKRSHRFQPWRGAISGDMWTCVSLNLIEAFKHVQAKVLTCTILMLHTLPWCLFWLTVLPQARALGLLVLPWGTADVGPLRKRNATFLCQTMWCIGHVGVNCVKFKDATHQRIPYHVQVQGRPSNDVVSDFKRMLFLFSTRSRSFGLASYNAGMVNYLPVLQKATCANLLEG